jgi:hypothetical protein
MHKAILSDHRSFPRKIHHGAPATNPRSSASRHHHALEPRITAFMCSLRIMMALSATTSLALPRRWKEPSTASTTEVRRAYGAGQCLKRSLTTRQYSRLVSTWVAMVGLDASLFGTHSLRRTKATLIYRKTGNLRAVQLLLAIRR